MNIAEYTEVLTWQSMTSKLSYLQNKYPDCAEIFTLGKSVLSRTIPTVKFGNGRHSYLYVGAHHGCEWITSVALLCFIEEMMDSLSKDGSEYGIKLSDMLREHCIYVIPMLNPDGVEYSLRGINENNPLYERLHAQFSNSDFSHWQANARGIDLNTTTTQDFTNTKKLRASLAYTDRLRRATAGAFPNPSPK